jgi:2-methylcitrate dehydratase PrpD
MGETEAVSRYIADLRYTSLPANIVEEMKDLLFDYIGVTLGGTRTASGRIAAEFSRDLEEKGESSIFGFGYRVSAPSATFSNAILSHSIELDDVDDLAYFHFSPPVFSAALAVAEREGASGSEVLAALAAGCDLMARLSAAMNPSLRDRGFHTTPTCGVFGAAAASSKLLNLNVEATTSALGLAGAQASGLMEMYGVSMQKRFNPGPAARSGVVSALLAERGFTGAKTILEGQRGFLRAFCDQFDHTKLTADLGKEFPIHVEYKPYACARPIHNAVDCALRLRREHGIRPEHIVKVSVYRHPLWAHYHTISHPRTYHEAQVSLPYSVAVSLVEGQAFLEQYTEEKLQHPLVQKLSQLVDVRVLEDLPRAVSCRMEVVLDDGSKYSTQVDYPKGSSCSPMTRRERRDKFKSLSSFLLNERRQTKAEEIVYCLEEIGDINELTVLLVPPNIVQLQYN